MFGETLRVCDGLGRAALCFLSGREGPKAPSGLKENIMLHTHCSIGSPGPSWTPLRTPGAFVAPAATIFVSATYLLLCTQTVASVVQYGLSMNLMDHPEDPWARIFVSATYFTPYYKKSSNWTPKWPPGRFWTSWVTLRAFLEPPRTPGRL